MSEPPDWSAVLGRFCAGISEVPALAEVPPADLAALAAALTELRGSLRVVRGPITQNLGGTIHLAPDVVAAGPEASLFAILHEIGHAVGFDPSVPDAVKRAVYPGARASLREAELFADAFAAVVMEQGGVDRPRILAAARALLEGDPGDEDHPPWSAREAALRQRR